MYDQLTEAQSKGKLSAAIMLDLSAAFDVVYSSILLDKMKPYGFKEPAVKWLSSYLSNRSQKVLIDGHLSSARNVPIGLPEGSILSPLLYFVYTNDLPVAVHDPHFASEENEPNFSNQCKNCGQMCLYAEKSTFSVSAEDPAELKMPSILSA